MQPSEWIPVDVHDQRLLTHVHPPDWRNPEPASLYDLVVLGGGTAGLVAAVGAAGLGARVALVERGLLGGDCLNTGCVPSKALLRAARAHAEVRGAAALGVPATAQVNFGEVMARVRARRADIAPHDSAARLQQLGVDVFFGAGRFRSRRTLVVNEQVLHFRRAVLATGSRPAVPSIPGLREIAYLTSDTLFSLTEQPRDLIVLGGGPVGCEMAQAFARLGTRVTLVESAARVLSGEDPDASRLIARRLEEDGIHLTTGVRVTRASQAREGIELFHDGGVIRGSALLLAAGRVVDFDGMGLREAGVEANAAGVRVDQRLRTTNGAIFAAGDVCSALKFTHAADAMARVVVRNALFFGRQRLDESTIPSCTYTAPEVAHVGVSTEAAMALHADTVTVPLAEVDRAVVDDEAEGFIRLHVVRSRLVGGTIVAPHAGELIGMLVSLMRSGKGVETLGDIVFPYPTVAMALKRAGDTYRRRRLTDGTRRWLRRYFSTVRTMRW